MAKIITNVEVKLHNLRANDVIATSMDNLHQSVGYGMFVQGRDYDDEEDF